MLANIAGGVFGAEKLCILDSKNGGHMTKMYCSNIAVAKLCAPVGCVQVSKMIPMAWKEFTRTL